MSPSFFVSLLILLPTIVSAADSKCYNLNGTELGSAFTPCKPASGSKHSGCCSSSDICLDSGLCMATTDKFVGTIWQNGCTDATGEDPACSKMCPQVSNDFEGYDPVPQWNIQTCDYGSYCCRPATDKGSCCSNLSAPKFSTSSLGAFQFSTATVTVSQSATASPTSVSSPTTEALTTSTPVSASASTLTPDLTCKKEKDQTMLVGGAVGGTLGAAVLGLLALSLWLYKKERRQRKLKEHYEEQFGQSYALRKVLGGSQLDSREVSTPSEKGTLFSESSSKSNNGDD